MEGLKEINSYFFFCLKHYILPLLVLVEYKKYWDNIERWREKDWSQNMQTIALALTSNRLQEIQKAQQGWHVYGWNPANERSKVAQSTVGSGRGWALEINFLDGESQGLIAI